MSIKSKVIASAAALTMAGGLGVAGAMGAHAATPPCGTACVSYSTLGWGPGNVLDAYKRAQKVGTALILWGASNADPAEDFTISAQGSVNLFYTAGLASAALNLHYGQNHAIEIEYSPYGVNSGLCVGTGFTAGNGTAVRLEPCGASSKTLWVQDKKDSGVAGYQVLINGSDTNFSHPYVMTNNGKGWLITAPLQKFSNGSVYDSQLWTAPRPVRTHA